VLESNSPKIVFVDGPTGVGKDYFIDNLKEVLNYKSDKIVSVIRATDIVLNSRTITENRKYTKYTTGELKSNSIFAGHINLLATINTKLNIKKECDLVIVNRSFLSFLIYNMYPIIDFERTDGSLFLKDQLKDFISIYSNLFYTLFYKTPSLFINLVVGNDSLSKCVDIIVERISSRKEKKDIDREWLETLVLNYSSPDGNLIKIFNHYEVIDSNGFNFIADNYFPI